MGVATNPQWLIFLAKIAECRRKPQISYICLWQQ